MVVRGGTVSVGDMSNERRFNRKEQELGVYPNGKPKGTEIKLYKNYNR